MAAAVLAAACGGGGDGGSSSDLGPQLPTYVKISAANQDTVARASIASILPFTSVPLLGTSPGPTGVATAQAGAFAPRGQTGLAQLALRSVGAGYRQLPSLPPGVARPLAQYQATSGCNISGTMTVNWDDRDNSGGVSAGDVLSVSFNQCSDWVGSTVNGNMGMSISMYSETSTTADMAGSMTFQSLAMVDGSVSFSLNGGIAFQINATSTTNGVNGFSTYTVASGGLTVVDSGSAVGFSDTFFYRGGYTVTERDFTSDVSGLPSTEELTARGDFGSQALGGDLSLATVQPLRSAYTDPNGDIFPTQGQMVATGQDGTKLSLSATQSSQVRMDMCDDGDGSWEATKMVEWSWLLQ